MRVVVVVAVMMMIVLCNSKCIVPKPWLNFTTALYSGVWFEMARFQTLGGAIFQDDCFCTEVNVSCPDPGLLKVQNLCRRRSPIAKPTSFSGVLHPTSNVGQFKEVMDTGLKAAYNVIYLSNHVAIEYDCSVDIFGIENYCIHFMARNRTLDNAVLQGLVDFALSQGLNQHDLKLKMTPQKGCR